ncbi:MAG TPA: hypothetical protein VFR38_05690 [Gaiellaceae bacterium]|nr:hypothetical protein [Gaiellaceae bacterium]
MDRDHVDAALVSGRRRRGAEWILVRLAVAVDLMSWSARVAKKRYAY